MKARLNNILSGAAENEVEDQIESFAAKTSELEENLGVLAIICGILNFVWNMIDLIIFMIFPHRFNCYWDLLRDHDYFPKEETIKQQNQKK